MTLTLIYIQSLFVYYELKLIKIMTQDSRLYFDKNSWLCKWRKKTPANIQWTDFFFFSSRWIRKRGTTRKSCPFLALHTKVTFQSPFEQAPTVTFGLYHLDNEWNTNLRVNTTVSGVTTTGFHISINPWADTILYGARIRLMACGK